MGGKKEKSEKEDREDEDEDGDDGAYCCKCCGPCYSCAELKERSKKETCCGCVPLVCGVFFIGITTLVYTIWMTCDAIVGYYN